MPPIAVMPPIAAILEFAENLPGYVEVERTNARERPVALRWNSCQVFLAARITVQSLPGKAAPPWNSEGVPLTIGVYSTPNSAAARSSPR